MSALPESVVLPRQALLYRLETAASYSEVSIAYICDAADNNVRLLTVSTGSLYILQEREPARKCAKENLFHYKFTLWVASTSRGLEPKWPLVLRSLPIPRAFINRYTWKSSHYIITTVMTSSVHECVLYSYHISMLELHQTNCATAIKSMFFYFRHISVLVFFLGSVCSLLPPCRLKSTNCKIHHFHVHSMQTTSRRMCVHTPTGCVE